MPDDLKWEWLDRYFSGECTPEEEREIQRWVAGAPERARRVEAMREIWARAARRPDRQWNARAAWHKLSTTLDVPSTPRRRLTVIPANRAAEPPRWSLRRAGGYAMRIAAAIAIVAGGAAIWQLAVEGVAPGEEQAVALREYTTPRGQRASLTLADGTRIMLGPSSTLRAPRDFAAVTRRDVYLEGEAFFEVTHDERRPFVVHAAHGVAEDLGTQFVVTAYPGDSAMRVVVAEGVVEIRGRSDSGAVAGRNETAEPRRLEPGDLGLVSQSGRITTAHDVALDEYFGWTSGQLVFRSAPLREVVTTLARWYDVDIRLADAELETRRVTLITEPTQPLTEIITALTVPLGLRATWSDSTVIIGS